MEQNSNHGVVRLSSRWTFDETVARLLRALQRRGLKLMADIDFSADASLVNLAMPATKLFIFGNPAAGTPIMLAVASVAIDLPLKALVQQDGDAVWVSYNSPAYLQERHGIPDALLKNINGIQQVCEEAAS